MQSLRGHVDFPADCPAIISIRREIFTFPYSRLIRRFQHIAKYFCSFLDIWGGSGNSHGTAVILKRFRLKPPMIFGVRKSSVKATAPVKLSTSYCPSIRIHGYRLGFTKRKGGVSLAPKLPPTLNMRNMNPIASYSKASRGLFV